jgi:hypothetical protein
MIAIALSFSACSLKINTGKKASEDTRKMTKECSASFDDCTQACEYKTGDDFKNCTKACNYDLNVCLDQ